MNNHSRKKMRLLAVKLASLQQELQISKQILQSAAREVDTMFKNKYFPEIPVTPEEATPGDQPIVEKSKQQSENQNTFDQDGNDKDGQPKDEEINNFDKLIINPKVKKVFRQIALKIHPDKLIGLEDGFEKSKKKELFQKAVKAMEEGDIIILADIAIEIGLEPPSIDEDTLKQAENKINSIKNEINGIESTYVWKWFFCVNKQQKNKILEKLFEIMYAKTSGA